MYFGQMNQSIKAFYADAGYLLNSNKGIDEKAFSIYTLLTHYRGI
jgi:hypothetical protein